MAKLRSVNTEFWSDEYVGELSRDEKLLFLYLLTNPLAKIAGAYKIAKRVILIDTGFELAELDALLERFDKDGKVFYRDGWVVLPNFLKNQSLNDNMRKNALSEMLDAPVWVQNVIGQNIKKSPKLTAEFGKHSDIVETLSTAKETLSTPCPNRKELELELEKNSQRRPGTLPNKIEQEIGTGLDGIAKIIGAKDGKSIADYTRWRRVVEQLVRAEEPMHEFLIVVKSEWAKGTPQYFTPDSVLRTFHARKPTNGDNPKRKTAAEYQAEVQASMEADRAGN